jgi:hypothetical protein
MIPFPLPDTRIYGFYAHFSGDIGALILYLGILENGLVGAAARGEAALGRPFCFWAWPRRVYPSDLPPNPSSLSS